MPGARRRTRLVPRRSRASEPHRVPYGVQRLSDHGPDPLAPHSQYLRDQTRLLSELEPPFPDRPELLDQAIGEVRLAVDAAELAGAAVITGPIDDVGREPRVQREDRADLRPAGIAPADLLWVGDRKS